MDRNRDRFKNIFRLITSNWQLRQLNWKQRLPLFLLYACIVVSPGGIFSNPQLFAQIDPVGASSTDDIFSDSLYSPINQDSLFSKRHLKLDDRHRSRPMHPYFRDSYRVIRDMRRLVLMFNRGAVNGYESVNDLVEVCQKLPEQKQTEMLYTAMAGGLVNFLSVETNKQLRKKKIQFLQWRMEKVFFRNNFKYFYVNIHAGYNTKGIAFYIPSLRLQYYRQFNSYYSSEGLTFFPTRKMGLNIARWNGHPVITPYFTSSIGRLALSYDKHRNIVRSRIDIRKFSSLVVRIVHINFLDRPKSDRLLSEVIIFW